MEDEIFDAPLNDMAWDLVHQLLNLVDHYRVEPVQCESGAMIVDFGVNTAGSLAAGLALAEICMASLADIQIVQGTLGDLGWPQIMVQTDSPFEACLFSQYGGWRISGEDYFAIGSGPMRAAANEEKLFQKYEYAETAAAVVGVLEASEIPTPEIVSKIAEQCAVSTDQVALMVAPTSSLAGTIQVVARSVETALHKLAELKFDVTRIDSAVGWAPIPPVGADDLKAIGLTNDALLYGARVTLWVTGDDESIAEIGPQIPSCSSKQYGKPFIEIFNAAGGDFYQIDPLLFSPAQVVLHNIDTGRVHHFGKINEEILKLSFGL